MTNNSTQYNAVMGSSDCAWTTTQNNTRAMVSTGGTLSKLYVWLDADPTTASSSYTFTLMQNGSATALTCTINVGSQSCSDTSNSVAVTAADDVEMRKTVANLPTATEARWALQFESTTAGESIYLGSGQSGNNAATRYSSINGCITTQNTAGDRFVLLAPTTGTLKNLYVEANDPTTVGSQRVYTIYRNETIATSITCTIAAGSTSCNDTSNTQTVSAGDFYTIRNTPSGGPVSGSNRLHVGVTFLADTAGEFILSDSTGSQDNANTTYLAVHEGSENDTTTENDHVLPVLAMTIDTIYVDSFNDPGVGNSFTYTLRKGATSCPACADMADTAVTCTASGAASGNCNATVSPVTIATGDFLSSSIDPTGTPSVGFTTIAYKGKVVSTQRRIFFLE